MDTSQILSRADFGTIPAPNRYQLDTKSPHYLSRFRSGAYTHPMASTTVYDETKAVLQGQFSPPYSILDFDQIEPTLMQGDAAFMALEEVTGNEVLNAFGDPTNLCQREEGIILVHFFTPSPQASGAARTLAELVLDFMRHRVYEGVRVVGASPPDVELMNNGLWAAGAIALTYRYDFYVSAPT